MAGCKRLKDWLIDCLGRCIVWLRLISSYHAGTLVDLLFTVRPGKTSSTAVACICSGCYSSAHTPISARVTPAGIEFCFAKFATPACVNFLMLNDEQVYALTFLRLRQRGQYWLLKTSYLPSWHSHFNAWQVRSTRGMQSFEIQLRVPSWLHLSHLKISQFRPSNSLKQSQA